MGDGAGVGDGTGMSCRTPGRYDCGPELHEYFLPRGLCKTRRGFEFLAIIATSSPTHGVVAPPGGKQGRVSTNPMAIGIPTEAHPIFFVTSTASVSKWQIERTRFAGARLAQPVLMGPDGKLSDDPNAFCGDPKGAIMPVGESNSVIRVSPSRSWLKR